MHAGSNLGVLRHVDEDDREAGDDVQLEVGKVEAVGVAVERRVEIGAGVAGHLDSADQELRARRVPLPGGLPG